MLGIFFTIIWMDRGQKKGRGCGLLCMQTHFSMEMEFLTKIVFAIILVQIFLVFFLSNRYIFSICWTPVIWICHPPPPIFFAPVKWIHPRPQFFAPVKCIRSAHEEALCRAHVKSIKHFSRKSHKTTQKKPFQLKGGGIKKKWLPFFILAWKRALKLQQFTINQQGK